MTPLDTRVDASLAEWISITWHEVPGKKSEARRLATAWLNAFSLVSYFDSFSRSAFTLLQKVEDRESYLWPLSTGPAQDPAGRFLLAIADYQSDRSLARMWWQLCELPPDVPFYHAPYALAGIRGLPPATDEDRGGFRPDVFEGLMTVGIALSRGAEQNRVNDAVARQEFLDLAAITIRAFPFPSRWREVLTAQGDTTPARMRPWLESTISSLPSDHPRRRASATRSDTAMLQPDPSWPKRAVSLSQSLKQTRDTRKDVNQLLDEQRRYALRTGHSDPLARSLCNFAGSIWDSDAATASEWASEAREWQPWDAYTWNTLTRALLREREHDRSVSVGWQAIERFPDNEISWNDLGAALAQASRLVEAEEVFWQSADRFPTRPYGWRGLGDVLRRRGDYPHAEAVYRRALGEFCPENRYLLDGLANVLKAVGRYQESVEEYQRALELDPASAYSWRGLAMAEKAAGNLDRAEQAFRNGLAANPGEEYLDRGLRALLRIRRDLGGSASTDPEPPLEEVEAVVPPPMPSTEVLGYLSTEEREAHLSTARTLRRAARRRREDLTDGQVPRQYAGQILADLRAARPWETRPLAEAMLGAAEAEDPQAAAVLLDIALERFPDAPQLAYAEARTRRELLALSSNGHADGLQSALTPLRRMRRLDLRLRAVELLETARAHLVVADSDGKGQSIDQLERLVNVPSSTSSFDTWWRGRVHGYVFSTSGPRSLTYIESRIRTYSRELDALAEDLTNRVTIPTG